MSDFDISKLTGGPAYVGGGLPTVMRGVIARPPLTDNDAMVVYLVNFGRDSAFEVPADHWQSRGGILPVEGAFCAVLHDDDGDAWVSVWSGVSPDLATQAELNAIVPEVHVGPSAPVDASVKVWIDNDEAGLPTPPTIGSVVTTLPTTGLFDGLEVLWRPAIAGSSSPRTWRMRYDSALLPYPWECVGGGGPSVAEDTASHLVSVAQNVWTTAFTPTLTLVAPYAGVYSIKAQAVLFPGAASATAWLGIRLTSSGAVVTDPVVDGDRSMGTYHAVVSARDQPQLEKEEQSLAAGDMLSWVMRSSTTAQNYTAYSRLLGLRPVRVAT